MRVKIESVTPDKSVKLKKINFSSWQPYLGITDEQDLFHRRTYIEFIKTNKREKHIYLSNN